VAEISISVVRLPFLWGDKTPMRFGYLPCPYVAASGSGVRRGEKKRLKDKTARPFPERQFAFPLLIFLRRA
jgi:hypothetical protein